MSDEWDDEEAIRRRARLRRRARVEGAEAAYEAALAICRDAGAPSQAKSNACRTLLQVAGMFEKTEGDESKELHEMSAKELAEAAARLRRRRSDMEVSAIAVAETEQSIFD